MTLLTEQQPLLSTVPVCRVSVNLGPKASNEKFQKRAIYAFKAHALLSSVMKSRAVGSVLPGRDCLHAWTLGPLVTQWPSR